MLAKLLWDPYRDVDDIIDEYCRAGFGPSAQTIRTYFDKLEQITNEIAAGRDFIRWRTNPEVLAEHYTDDIVNELNALLDRADRLAGGDDSVRNRIGFLRTGLEYVPISRDYILARTAARNGNSEARKKYVDARAKRIAWFQELGYSWALSVPLLMYHDF